MQEEKITRILNVEHDAVEIYENAQIEAEEIITKAQHAADILRRQTLKNAQHQADKIITEGRKAADSRRAEVIAHAGADAQSLETVSTRHFEEAVDFILNKVTGRAAS